LIVHRLLIAALLCLALPARAAPTIEVYTMGRGEDLFSAFGHAAICVRDARSPQGRCYNYGTADFRTPVPLTWSFIRGRALFWVSVLDLPRMLSFYRQEGRAVWRQRLRIDDAHAERLAAALEASTDERVKYYRYHHFDDNCTTRIRDLVDLATDGALRRGTVDRGRTFREWARDGFVGSWPMLGAVELFLGRSADRRTDSWTAMFLPSELRAEVATRLGSPPELVVVGQLGPPTGSHLLGQLLFVLGGLALALLLVAGARMGPRSRRLALLATGGVLGLVAVVLDVLYLVSTFPEFTRNEALLIFWPTDLALGLLPRRWLRIYALVRIAWLVALTFAHLFLLVQPLAPLAMVALPFVALTWSDRRFAHNLLV
jgi:hypothetical protein